MEIMRYLQTKTKLLRGRVLRGIIFGYSFNGWSVAGWHYVQQKELVGSELDQVGDWSEVLTE